MAGQSRSVPGHHDFYDRIAKCVSMAKKTRRKSTRKSESKAKAGRAKATMLKRKRGTPAKKQRKKAPARKAAPKKAAVKTAKPKTAKPTTAPKPAPPAAASAGGKPRYYVTTAIAYPNGVPHIGHAYEAIATDAIARFMRLDGYDVYFLTGTDEHGIKMLQTASKEGITPRELADRNVELFRKMVRRMNCSNDDYIRTTEPRHYASSAAIWERMAKAGDIYLSKYSGW